MSIAAKTAGIFGPSAEQAAAQSAALNKFYGDKMLSSLGAGAGVGLGATALYHLLRNLKPTGKKEKKYIGYGSGSPVPAKTASFAPQQTFTAGMMGQGKSAFDLSKLQEALGGMLPKTMIPFSVPGLPGGSAPAADPHAWRKAWGTAANIGAGALGVYGGKKVVDSVVSAKKKKDLEAEMEAARHDYYSALAGDKSAAALDFAFATVKHANILDTLGGVGSAVVNTPQALRTAYLLAMLGAGGVGAKYMYDRTKEMTVGENLAKAQASRARTKGLPPVWVDPESLAHMKALAGSHE
jgi:hypothetical protein